MFSHLSVHKVGGGCYDSYGHPPDSTTPEQPLLPPYGQHPPPHRYCPGDSTSPLASTSSHDSTPPRQHQPPPTAPYPGQQPMDSTFPRTAPPLDSATPCPLDTTTPRQQPPPDSTSSMTTPPTHPRSRSGWYASSWNAFLLVFFVFSGLHDYGRNKGRMVQ